MRSSALTRPEDSTRLDDPRRAVAAQSTALETLNRPFARRREAGDYALLGRMGDLEVRLATEPWQVTAAKRLRFEVFYEELSATPDSAASRSRLDQDSFDPVCDHILVVDRTETGAAGIVGAYRVLRSDQARAHGRFYSAGTFDIQPLIDRNRQLNFMELGRSCVRPAYRNKRTIELLWSGIWRYVNRHDIDVLFGCASFFGTDPDELAAPLTFLRHHALAPEPWRVAPHAGLSVAMDRMDPEMLDTRRVLAGLPPLVKGYLRLGAYVGDGAVIDRQFGTTDVLIVLPRSRIDTRYIAHFGETGERFAG